LLYNTSIATIVNSQTKLALLTESSSALLRAADMKKDQAFDVNTS
jgi:hypothetical protein